MAESGLVSVRVRECPDATHPDGDVVYMTPTVGLELGLAAEMDMQSLDDIPAERKVRALMAKWAVTYVMYGAVGWNLHHENANGKSEEDPFDVRVLLADYTLGKPVADKGADLYGPTVMAPFLDAAERVKTPRPPRSSDGSTSKAISASPVSIQSRRKSSSDPSTAGPQSATAP